MEVYRDKERRNWSILYSEKRENVEWENMEVGESEEEIWEWTEYVELETAWKNYSSSKD